MIFERDYFIHYYDTDPDGRATISSIMRYLEDIAILHSEFVDLGINYYLRRHVIWMLYKWDIRIQRLPSFQDTVKVRTIATFMKGFQAYRYFEILNSEGQQLVAANSMWLFINTDTKKPIKIFDEIYSGYDVDINNMAVLEIGTIGEFKNTENEKEFNIRYSDIDSNNHVNNIKYVDWGLEMVPPEINKTYTLTRLKVNYKKEIGYGDKIVSSVSVDRGEKTARCIHKITSHEMQLCLLETDWCR